MHTLSETLVALALWRSRVQRIGGGEEGIRSSTQTLPLAAVSEVEQELGRCIDREVEVG